MYRFRIMDTTNGHTLYQSAACFAGDTVNQVAQLYANVFRNQNIPTTTYIIPV